MPRAEAPNRKRWETFEYDYLGNITKSNDDAAKRYDRSLGVQIGEPGRPERLSSADGVAIRYDEAGNMTDMTVERPGPCESALPCNQRYVYDWNEIGQLARARRWDYAEVVPAITDTPEWDLHYAYSGGQ